MTLQQLETGGIPPLWKKESIGNWSNGVEQIKEKMSAGQVPISKYLDAIGHL